MENSDLKDFSARLAHIPIFKTCDRRALDRLAAGGSRQGYKKGEALFNHKSPADRYFIIQSGIIKLFRQTLDGTQAVIDVATTGRVFGETSIFENDLYPYSAEAIENSEVITLSLADLKKEIEDNSRLAFSMLKELSHQRQHLEQEVERLWIQNAAQRIGCFLLHLPPEQKNGGIVLRLPYEKSLVASKLGMQPETFSRALGTLREKTGARINGLEVEIADLQQLSRYSCRSCTSEFPCQDTDAA